MTNQDLPFNFVEKSEAFKAFELGLEDGLHPDDAGGKNGQSFADSLQGVEADMLPQGRIKRSEVFAFAADVTMTTATVCAAVMAWGGMNQRFSERFFGLAGTGWLDVAERIRAGKLDRQQAYSEFSALRQNGKLHGVGPAYFTKLIYFLTPRQTGSDRHAYIMDQWAGCSINLLLRTELVKMDVIRNWHVGRDRPECIYRVSEANTATDYDQFCLAVDALRLKFNLQADQVDRAMIANGGKNKSSWRRYVIQHRSI